MANSSTQVILEDNFLESSGSYGNDAGNFKVFKFEDYIDCGPEDMPYRRRDYYKITLAKAKNKLYYADKAYETKKQSLMFTNPSIPYHWEQLDADQEGYFCVFTDEFFKNFGNLDDYAFFLPEGVPVYELTDEQYDKINAIFLQMFQEIGSNFLHKYDLMRNLVFQILHSAAKMYPAVRTQDRKSSATERLSTLFVDLLERQFPIEDPYQGIRLRSASEYAKNLSVHVNHLNKVLQEKFQKSTSGIISSRILQEAKSLLKHTDWTVAEIAHSLGFKQPTHFNNFFKKHTQTTPTHYRNI